MIRGARALNGSAGVAECRIGRPRLPLIDSERRGCTVRHQDSNAGTEALSSRC
jgi:hypothetical protein